MLLPPLDHPSHGFAVTELQAGRMLHPTSMLLTVQ